MPERMSDNIPDNPEQRDDKFIISRVSDALDFGYGNISGHDDDPYILDLVDSAITQSSEILTEVDKDDEGHILDDDGCSDGRETILVYQLDKVYKRSLNRAKVFGGSVAMAAASMIGVGRVHDKSLNEVFETAVSTLNEKKLNFGGHTDEHAHGDNCGCGAIDRAPDALFAALKYEEPIRDVINALGISSNGIDEVFANFRGYVGAWPEQEDYKPLNVMDRIFRAGKVVKRLGGPHRERRILLNQVRGYTVNQKLIRDVTQGRAQAFAVDTWRLEDIAANLYNDQPDLQHQALLSELVYTLAVAAVLTKGDLPVYMIQDIA